MKKSIRLTLLISLITISAQIYGNDTTPRLFIMLDVDNTIMDRAAPHDVALEKRLLQEGYNVQHLTFITPKISSPKFYALYQDPQHDTFATKLKLLQVSPDSVAAEEIMVIRPAIQAFIEGLLHLNKKGIETHILVCSRNDNIRNQKLVEELNLKVNGQNFREVVEFVPREAFRVEIELNGASNVAAKSAVALREHYRGKHSPISANDCVILIDQLPDDRFIGLDATRDMNLPVSGFETDKHSEAERIRDEAELQCTLKRITNFIEANINNQGNVAKK